MFPSKKQMEVEVRTKKRKRSSGAAEMTGAKNAQIRSLIRKELKATAELKHLDVMGSYTITSGGVTTAVCNIPQGSGVSTRDGDSVALHSVEIHGTIENGADNNQFRICVWQWRSASAPVGTEAISAVGTYPYLNCQNWHFRGNVKILRDQLFSLNAPFTGGKDRKAFHYVINKGFLKKVIYQSGGTTGNNEIFVTCYSDNTGASSVTLRMNTRVNFFDM